MLPVDGVSLWPAQHRQKRASRRVAVACEAVYSVAMALSLSLSLAVVVAQGVARRMPKTWQPQQSSSDSSVMPTIREDPELFCWGYQVLSILLATPCATATAREKEPQPRCAQPCMPRPERESHGHAVLSLACHGRVLALLLLLRN